LQIILFSIFLLLEEGSPSNLLISVKKNICGDARGTFKMALPPILLLLASEFKGIADEIMPTEDTSTSSFYIIGVAVCSVLILRRKFLLTQALAIMFISMGLTYFPGEHQAAAKLSNLFGNDELYAYISIALAISCFGLSFAILEHSLKASDASLWIRGIQLNLFVVPIALAFSLANYYFDESPRGFFDNFNIISSFYIIFLVACLMMKLFVVKVADAMFCMIASSIATMIIGVMKSPFSLDTDSPVRIGTGLILAGSALYILMDVMNPNLSPLGEETCRSKDVQSYIIPMKLYQSVPTVSYKVKNSTANES
jgi:UDP-sugar transporter A1/2/3